jgi:hypothetical protein
MAWGSFGCFVWLQVLNGDRNKDNSLKMGGLIRQDLSGPGCPLQSFYKDFLHFRAIQNLYKKDFHCCPYRNLGVAFKVRSLSIKINCADTQRYYQMSV